MKKREATQSIPPTSKIERRGFVRRVSLPFAPAPKHAASGIRLPPIAQRGGRAAAARDPGGRSPRTAVAVAVLPFAQGFGGKRGRRAGPTEACGTAYPDGSISLTR